MEEFKFDYDRENDDLFLYSGKNKSKASIEIGNIILDFDKNRKLSGIEIMNATRFLNSLITEERISITKDLLSNLVACRVDSRSQDNLLLIRIVLLMKHKKIPLNLSIPQITKPSPAVSHTN